MEIPRFRRLKRKIETDEYFVSGKGRLRVLNRLLKANQEQAAIGVIKETEGVCFIRSDEKDAGDIVWIEVTPDEAEQYKKTGDKNFLKNDLVDF